MLKLVLELLHLEGRGGDLVAPRSEVVLVDILLGLPSAAHSGKEPGMFFFIVLLESEGAAVLLHVPMDALFLAIKYFSLFH